jgi:hypothetical protein
MLAIRQKAFQSAGRLGAARVTCRYASGHHGKEGDEVHHFAGSSKEHGEHHAGPAEESFGVCSIYLPLSQQVLTFNRCNYTLLSPSFLCATEHISFHAPRKTAPRLHSPRRSPTCTYHTPRLGRIETIFIRRPLKGRVMTVHCSFIRSRAPM